MNYKNYPDNYWNEISKTIETLKQSKNKLVAAFDADGTLWDTDLGENFFQYQIDNKLVPMPEDPWKHYLDMKKVNGDPRDAYIWLAQINKNIPLATVRDWSQKAFDGIRPNPIFSEQKKLIALLQSHNVDIYIVTASIKWAVEPGALAVGLKPENVIGVETAVQNGLVTDEKLFPITYRQGKVDALLKRTDGILPFLSSGNTIGDYELLQSATHIKLAVSAASRDDKLFKAESELQSKATEHNWWGHRFI